MWNKGTCRKLCRLRQEWNVNSQSHSLEIFNHEDKDFNENDGDCNIEIVCLLYCII